MSPRKARNKVTPRKGRLASRRGVSAGRGSVQADTATSPREALAQSGLEDILSEGMDDPELDLERLMHTAPGGISLSARRMIELYRDERALQDAMEDGVFDTLDPGSMPDDLMSRDV